jgi:hypothetical protein
LGIATTFHIYKLSEMKKEVNTYIESGLDSQVTQVGMEFEPGCAADAEIDCLLGFDTQYAGGSAFRTVGVEISKAPSYSTDEMLCRKEAGKIDAWQLICPTLDNRTKKSKKDFFQEYVAVYSLGGEIYITVPQPTRASAAACGLLSALQTKSQMT